MNYNSPLFILGDRIKSHIEHDSVISASDFLATSHHQETAPYTKVKNVHIGQGLTDQQRSKLLNLVNQDNMCEKFLGENYLQTKKASTEMTHKNIPSNILIADPIKLDHNHFISALLIDDHCNEMSDHLTGQHIQAMVLIEAARQMNTAVAKKYLIPTDKKNQISLVLHKLESDFKHYVYPLATDIHCKIGKLRNTPTGDYRALANISFIQGGIKRAEMSLDYAVFNKNFIDTQEKLGINDLIQTLDAI